MQLTLGAGMRMVNQNPNLIGDTRVNAGANTAQSSNGDDGNLNYNKHDLFTTYLKFTPELLLKFPADFKFMARGTALYDFKATDTRRTDLSDDAERPGRAGYPAAGPLGEQGPEHRLPACPGAGGEPGHQLGESIFAIGGINSTNSLDFQKLSIPGTQLKEAVLPAPIVSVASGLGHGVNVEAYYQFRWNRNRLPPVGTYFSVADILGKRAGSRCSSTSSDAAPISSISAAWTRAACDFGASANLHPRGSYRGRQDPEEQRAVRRRDALQAGGRLPGPRVLLHELPRQDAGPERVGGRHGPVDVPGEPEAVRGQRELPRRELGGGLGAIVPSEGGRRPDRLLRATRERRWIRPQQRVAGPDRLPDVHRREEVPDAPDGDPEPDPGRSRMVPGSPEGGHRHVHRRGRGDPVPRGQPQQAVHPDHRRGRS